MTLTEFFNVLFFELSENILMNHKELVDQVSASFVRKNGKMESRRSWLAMRIYLEQLDIEQLKELIKETP